MKGRIRIRSINERTSIHAVNTISIEQDPIHQSVYIFITSIWSPKKSISELNIRSRNSIVYARHHNIPCQSIQIHHVHLVDFCPGRSQDFAFCRKMQFARHHWRRHNRKRKQKMIKDIIGKVSSKNFSYLLNVAYYVVKEDFFYAIMCRIVKSVTWDVLPKSENWLRYRRAGIPCSPPY